MAQIGADAPEVVLKSVFSKYDKVWLFVTYLFIFIILLFFLFAQRLIFEQDNSGTISSLELKSLCYDLGYYLENEEAAEILRNLDKGNCNIL